MLTKKTQQNALVQNSERLWQKCSNCLKKNNKSGY